MMRDDALLGLPLQEAVRRALLPAEWCSTSSRCLTISVSGWWRH